MTNEVPRLIGTRWLMTWCLGSLVSLIIAMVPWLTVTLSRHTETWLLVAMQFWAGGLYLLGSALSQARAIGLRRTQRLTWIGVKIGLDWVAMATVVSALASGRVLGSRRLFVATSVGLVLLCGAPLAWYLSRLVDIAARAYAYTAMTTQLLALTATSYLIGGSIGDVLLGTFAHPFGQLFLRDVSFGIALWSTARKNTKHA